MIHTFASFPSPLNATTLEPAVAGQVWVADGVLHVQSTLATSQVESALALNNAETLAAEEAKAAAKASAIAKLAALGLTEEEAAALVGQ